MATRIDIELTSQQDGGSIFTWRAAGAKQPKGAADASLFPEGAQVGDEFRVEAEMDLDGIQVTTVLPPKDKPAKKQVETLELIGPADEGPLVTQELAGGGKGRGGRRGEGRGRKGGAGSGGGRREGRDGRESGEGRESRGGKGGRPRTPAKPKLPPKPKPPRLKAGKTHRNALLDSLPDEQKAVAQELLRGGLQAVRQGLADQNEQRKAEGVAPIDEGPIITLAEELLLKVRAAEWVDRAEAALEQAETVDLRDLRSVVTAADGAAKDDETRALAAKLRTALNERLDADQQAWVDEVVEMLDDDRVVRALHLSSRPPKAGAPLPAPVAMRLVEATNAAMNSEVTPDRWGYLIEALAHSPIRRQVVPVSLPSNVPDDLRTTIAKHGNRLPELAQIFGIEPDPKAGRAGGPRKRRGGSTKRGDKPKGGDKPKDQNKSESKGESEGEKATAEGPTVEEPTVEEPTVEESKAEENKAGEDTPPQDTPAEDEPADKTATAEPSVDQPEAAASAPEASEESEASEPAES